MTEVYVKENLETGRFDCYNALTDKFEQTLTMGNSFILILDEDDLEVPGRIEHNSTHGYYWTDTEEVMVQYLRDGMKGYVE